MISILRAIERGRERMLAKSRSDDGVAMLSAIMFMIIMAGISILLVTVVMGQIVPVGTAEKSTRTIYSAQAGIQASVNLLRSASTTDTTGKVVGAPNKLPCTVKGDTDGTSNGVKYSASIVYYKTNPKGQSTSWLADTTNQVSCNPLTGLTAVPPFALITSLGAAPVVGGLSDANFANRSISAIYQFQVSNTNIIGGRILDYNGGWCMEASSASVGATVKFLALGSCTNDTLDLWIYDTDYEIKLASTTLNNQPGLCITGPATSGGANGNATLQTCLSTANRWNQLWSWTGSNSWVGENQAITGPSSYCLSTGAAAGASLLNKFLQINNGCNGGFAPSAAVGAGAASYNTHQIVNYQEFGRCADVTGEQITAAYMISYPCKQDPTGTGVNLLWNHKWYYTEPAGGIGSTTGPIYVYYLDNLAQKYCLTAPSSTGKYPTFTLCTLTPSATQTWTRVDKDTAYVSSYVFKDNLGRCLTADPTDTAPIWSKVTVTTCTGSDAQKWNAPASSSLYGVKGYKEVN